MHIYTLYVIDMLQNILEMKQNYFKSDHLWILWNFVNTDEHISCDIYIRVIQPHIVLHDKIIVSTSEVTVLSNRKSVLLKILLNSILLNEKNVEHMTYACE